MKTCESESKVKAQRVKEQYLSQNYTIDIKENVVYKYK